MTKQCKEIITGNDKVVRGGTVKTCTNGTVSRIQRPLQRLYPLEIENSSSERNTISDSADPENNVY